MYKVGEKTKQSPKLLTYFMITLESELDFNLMWTVLNKRGILDFSQIMSFFFLTGIFCAAGIFIHYTEFSKKFIK